MSLFTSKVKLEWRKFMYNKAIVPKFNELKYFV